MYGTGRIEFYQLIFCLYFDLLTESGMPERDHMIWGASGVDQAKFPLNGVVGDRPPPPVEYWSYIFYIYNS